MKNGSERVVNIMGLRVQRLEEGLFGEKDKLWEGIVVGQPSASCYYMLTDEGEIKSMSYTGTKILPGQTIDPHDVLYFENISEAMRDLMAETVAKNTIRGMH